MNPRENLMAALKHQQVEWIPWIPLIGGPNVPCFVPEGIKKRHDDLEVGLYLYEQLQCDVFIVCTVLKTKYKTTKVTQTEKEDIIFTTFEIGGRILTTSKRKLAFGDQDTSHILEYPVKCADDLKTLTLLMHDAYPEVDLTEYRRVKKGLGDKGVAVANVPQTPIMDLIIHYTGLELFVYLLADYTEEVEEAIEALDRFNVECYGKIADKSNAIEAVESYEDSSSLLISPGMFEKYILPSLVRYADLCHKAGVIYIVHTCGHNREFLSLFSKSGIDALHYLSTPPVGNTPFKEAKEAWGDRITIMGAVDPVLLVEGTPEQVEKDVVSKLRELLPGTSSIVLSSSKPDIPEANIRVVGDIMHKYGRMP